jgi:large subunit ribosomal protein L30
MADLKITQKRSVIGRPPAQRRTIRALGLRRIGHSVVHPDTPSIRGMVFGVQHLVEVEEVSAGR